MNSTFDETKAKENLLKKESEQKAAAEKERLLVLERTLTVLKEYFQDQQIAVYLVGSVTIPGKFNPKSDVDIVLKNFHGDRFEVWGELERRIERDVEIILYENCSYKEFVDEKALRVI